MILWIEYMVSFSSNSPCSIARFQTIREWNGSLQETQRQRSSKSTYAKENEVIAVRSCNSFCWMASILLLSVSRRPSRMAFIIQFWDERPNQTFVIPNHLTFVTVKRCKLYRSNSSFKDQYKNILLNFRGDNICSLVYSLTIRKNSQGEMHRKRAQIIIYVPWIATNIYWKQAILILSWEDT